MRRAIVVAVLCAMSGCVAQAPFRPASATSKADAPALYKAAARVLVDRGSAAETTDVNAGLVVGRYDESEMLGTRYRYRWRIAIDQGKVRVDSDCQWFNKDPLTGAGDWKPCENQPEGRTGTAQAIAADVVRIAEQP